MRAVNTSSIGSVRSASVGLVGIVQTWKGGEFTSSVDYASLFRS